MLKSILCCLGILIGRCVFGQVDTLKLRLSDLLIRYENSLIRDTDYLRAVDSIAPLLAKEDSLPQLLSVYRDLAFSDPRRGKYRAAYYTYLAINDYNFSRLGSAIYYSEKNNEERTLLGQFERGGFTHSDWFALTVYANNHNYARVFARYAALRTGLKALPSAIVQGKTSPEQVFIAVSILQTVNYAACRSGDTARAQETIGLMGDIMNSVARLPVKYKDYRLEYAYLLHSMYYEYHRLFGKWGPAGACLLAAIQDVNTKGFKVHLQNAYLENLYSEAVDLYFNQNKTDSAQHYLSLLTEGEGKVRYSSLDPGFLPESRSRLLAGEGRYKEAYAELQKVYSMRDSAYYAVSADKDNNLYALAEAENTHAELLRLEEKKNAAERSTLLLYSLLVLLVVGGASAFLVYRSAEQKRLLDLRLQLARNFHDEIGPMLLYAGMLAKKEGEAHPTSRGDELKEQIGLVMDAVRNISHDLKSARLNTIGSLGKEISGLLEKVRAAAEIHFSLRVGNGARILSHGQFIHLQAIVQEMISNSIKHADCHKITVRIGAPDRKLNIEYSDDGEGINPGMAVGLEGRAGSGGIGLANIQERVAMLKGEFQLNNDWPRGYSITISIPLV